jgi:hypothetical protein
MQKTKWKIMTSNGLKKIGNDMKNKIMDLYYFLKTRFYNRFNKNKEPVDFIYEDD